MARRTLEGIHDEPLTAEEQTPALGARPRRRVGLRAVEVFVRVGWVGERADEGDERGHLTRVQLPPAAEQRDEGRVEVFQSGAVAAPVKRRGRELRISVDDAA